MRALSIRQPFAELILRGIKTVELRSRATRIVGERFWIYASKGKSRVERGVWGVKIADNIVVPREDLPAWMIELAEQVKMIEAGTILPTGVIVGSARIAKCVAIENAQLTNHNSQRSSKDQPSTNNYPRTTLFAWHLSDVERARTLRKPRKHPQPVWFKPF